jgi:hypothetical protein
MNEVVFAGAATLAQCEAIKGALESCDADSLGTFIPGQVGLKDMQDSFYDQPIAMAEAMGDNDMVEVLMAVKPIWWPDDHPFHELLMIDHVRKEPTDPRSVDEIVNLILTVDWDPEYLPPFHADMLENHEKHLRGDSPEI